MKEYNYHNNSHSVTKVLVNKKSLWFFEDRVPNKLKKRVNSQLIICNQDYNLDIIFFFDVYNFISYAMSAICAAGFSLGAQTAAGMIRRSDVVDKGIHPVVFSAKSATLLFVIKQLVHYGFEPKCFTTSEWTESEKESIYPAKIEVISKDYIQEKQLANKFTHAFRRNT